MVDKQQDLDECLSELANPNQRLSAGDVNRYIQKLKDIYADDFRHQYSRLFGVVSGVQSDQSRDLETLITNIDRIYHSACEQTGDEVFHKSLHKLYDHVNLDVARLEFTKKIVDEVAEQNSTTAEELKDLKESAKNMQRDYVTILGIFAAIILAFVAGITFSTSVLSNIDKVTVYHLTYVVLLIALILFNLLRLLLDFIENINNRQRDSGGYINTVNIAIFIMMVVDIVCWLADWYRSISQQP